MPSTTDISAILASYVRPIHSAAQTPPTRYPVAKGHGKQCGPFQPRARRGRVLLRGSIDN